MKTLGERIHDDPEFLAFSPEEKEQAVITAVTALFLLNNITLIRHCPCGCGSVQTLNPSKDGETVRFQVLDEYAPGQYNPLTSQKISLEKAATYTHDVWLSDDDKTTGDSYENN